MTKSNKIKLAEAKLRIAERELKELKESMGGYTTFTNSKGEKDDFYDPYKQNPPEYTEKDYANDRDSDANAYVGKDTTDTSESTKELIAEYKKLKKFINLCNTTDYLHDIRHDGDYDGYYEETKKFKDACASVNSILEELAKRDQDADLIDAAGLTKAVEAAKKRIEADAQKKADWKAKMQAEEAEIAKKVDADPLAALIEAIQEEFDAEKRTKSPAYSLSGEDYDYRAEDYIVKYLDQQQHIIDSETGLFYNKSGYGYLKQFLDPFWKRGVCRGKYIFRYGKTLKAIWVKQFKSN